MRMQKQDPFEDLTRALNKETAGSLGSAGRRLQRAVAALEDYDAASGGSAGSGGTRAAGTADVTETAGARDDARRRGLVHAAAAALHAYVIQKEVIGIADNATLNEAFRVTADVWRCMGAVQG
jgi:hypothetical protein